MSTRSPSRVSATIGRVLSALVVAFMAVDGGAKLLKPDPVVEGTVALGFPESSIVPLGVILLASSALYSVPRTMILGAILLTGYLGGAVAAHVRIGNPLFSHTLFPVYLGLMTWLGVWLRSPEFRSSTAFRTLHRPDVAS